MIDRDDDRSTVEVRAVPAPFTIVPPSTPTERQLRPAALSLADELRLTLAMGPEDQKRRLIEILRSCRFAMMREVQDLTGEQAATPWTDDGRSMKEIVGHITAWERWTASAFEEIEQGMAEPGIMSLSGYREGISRYGSVDAFNGARMAEAREMPWSQILDQSSSAFESLIEIAERTPAGSLAQTASFYWPALGATVPCGFYLLMVSAHHYEVEHRGEVMGSRFTGDQP